ncbi:MFS transporter [Legionella waltersii]|uniref:Multidrug resistance protein, MFS superfamily n=1 Tax=Legionella waltersii TaxID=66969 RepID=A0A0W1ALN3_9GAMM|nr:MFS transporter [Legionella waltersii]KTD82267.1 multidrug resistance protein, MFS superfamily [Legionella waltersii]SNV04387.1 multidrug resistance protein, MFS superfamily [Legionella waltersii]
MNTETTPVKTNPLSIGILSVILAASAFVQLIAIGSLPLLPFIGLDLHVSTPNMQLLIPVYLGGIIVSQFIISFNAEIYGRRRIYIVSLVIAVLGLLFWMAARSRLGLYFALFLEAFAAGGLLSLSNAMIKDSFPPESHSRIFGAVSIVMWVTAIVAPLASGYLLKYLGWRCTVGVYCIASVIVLALAYFILPETSVKKGGDTITIKQLVRESRSLFTCRLFLGSALIGGAINAIPTAFNTLAPFFFMSTYSLPAQTIGDYLMIPGIGILLGLISSEIIGNRVSHLVFIRVGVYLCGLASLGLFLLGMYKPINLMVILSIVSVTMFSMGLITPHYWSAALSPIKDISAVAASVIVLMQQVFAMLTSFFISLLSANSILPMTITITCLSVIALFFTVYVLPRDIHALTK